MKTNPYIQYTIDRYRVYLFTQAEPQPARILLYGTDGHIHGNIWFRPDGAELPSPIVNRREVSPGREIYEVTMYHPVSNLVPLVDLLRYEKPIHLYFNPENGKGGIATGVEEVGEGE